LRGGTHEFANAERKVNGAVSGGGRERINGSFKVTHSKDLGLRAWRRGGVPHTGKHREIVCFSRIPGFHRNLNRCNEIDTELQLLAIVGEPGTFGGFLHILFNTRHRPNPLDMGSIRVPLHRLWILWSTYSMAPLIGCGGCSLLFLWRRAHHSGQACRSTFTREPSSQERNR